MNDNTYISKSVRNQTHAYESKKLSNLSRGQLAIYYKSTKNINVPWPNNFASINVTMKTNNNMQRFSYKNVHWITIYNRK